MYGVTVLDAHGRNTVSVSKSSFQQQHEHFVRMVPLPNSFSQSDNTNNSPINTNRKKSPTTARTPATTARQRPFVVLELPFSSPLVPESAKSNLRKHHKNTDNNNDHENVLPKNQDIAYSILSRCTLVRSVIELWSMADSIESCAQATFAWAQHSNVGKSIIPPSSSSSSSSQQQQDDDDDDHHHLTWKFTIHTLGSKYTRDEQSKMRNLWTTHPVWADRIRGPIQLEHPDREFVLIREVELDAKGGAVYPRHDNTPQRQIIPENDIRPPLAVYFGRALCGARLFQRQIVTTTHSLGDDVKNTTTRIDAWSLKNRVYLGPTSMDAELSLVMTNLGQVQKSHVVLDPFVGTGSILLACALRGAHCIGTDIDIRVLRGKNPHQNVFANFRQYQLPRPELIRSDNGIYHRHFVNHLPLYDAILCDPPYGIRAGARKSGSKKSEVVPVKEEERHDHIAMTQPYAVADVMADLLDMAARTLVLGGRLVYVIPSFATDFDVENDLPQHPCLDWIHVCYQQYTPELGRRIVAMKKIQEYDSSKRNEYMSTVWKNGPASAEKCANIRDKILEAAKQKPGYEARLAIRKEKRKKHKEEKRQAKRQQQEQQKLTVTLDRLDEAQNICK
jgi:tRNA (guanine10-N2)-methyltransferase